MTCEQMDTVTYPDSGVRGELQSWATARLDVSKAPGVARVFGVPAVPTALAVASDGRVVGRKAGFVEPKAFVLWLRSLREARR